MAVLDETGAVTPTARTQSFLGRWRLSPLVAVLAAILLILILPPTLYLVVTSFLARPARRLVRPVHAALLSAAFLQPLFPASLRNTVIYAFGSALVAIVLGVVQALIVERTNTPGRQLRLSRRRRLARHSACALYRWRGCCCSAAPGR